MEAFFDIWILGDNFVKEVVPSLQALKRKVIAAGGGLLLPYIYQQYNVKDYHMGTGYSGISCMIHPLIQTLNDNHMVAKVHIHATW